MNPMPNECETFNEQVDFKRCKGCGQKYKSILGHINNAKYSRKCGDNYSSDEIKQLKRECRDKRNQKRRTKYDPVKRAQRYMDGISRDTAIIKESGKYHHYEVCKGCGQIYYSIFVHLNKASNCKSQYSSEELKQLKTDKHEVDFDKYRGRKRREQKMNYNSELRKERYQAKKAEKREKLHEDAMERIKEFLIKFKKDEEEKARKRNLCSKKLAQKILKEASEFFPSQYEEITQKSLYFQEMIDSTYEFWEKEIESAVQKIKSHPECGSGYVSRKFRNIIPTSSEPCSKIMTMWDSWHDLKLKMDVEMKKIADAKGQIYSYVVVCVCKKCKSEKKVKKFTDYTVYRKMFKL